RREDIASSPGGSQFLWLAAIDKQSTQRRPELRTFRSIDLLGFFVGEPSCLQQDDLVSPGGFLRGKQHRDVVCLRVKGKTADIKKDNLVLVDAEHLPCLFTLSCLEGESVAINAQGDNWKLRDRHPARAKPLLQEFALDRKKAIDTPMDRARCTNHRIPVFKRAQGHVLERFHPDVAHERMSDAAQAVGSGRMQRPPPGKGG